MSWRKLHLVLDLLGRWEFARKGEGHFRSGEQHVQKPGSGESLWNVLKEGVYYVWITEWAPWGGRKWRCSWVWRTIRPVGSQWQLLPLLRSTEGMGKSRRAHDPDDFKTGTNHQDRNKMKAEHTLFLPYSSANMQLTSSDVCCGFLSQQVFRSVSNWETIRNLYNVAWFMAAWSKSHMEHGSSCCCLNWLHMNSYMETSVHRKEALPDANSLLVWKSIPAVS